MIIRKELERIGSKDSIKVQRHLSVCEYLYFKKRYTWTNHETHEKVRMRWIRSYKLKNKCPDCGANLYALYTVFKGVRPDNIDDIEIEVGYGVAGYDVACRCSNKIHNFYEVWIDG